MLDFIIYAIDFVRDLSSIYKNNFPVGCKRLIWESFFSIAIVFGKASSLWSGMQLMSIRIILSMMYCRVEYFYVNLIKAIAPIECPMIIKPV
jgi:hypothetical protein